MLKRVTFSGFKIFKNETVIDFAATRSEILKDTNVDHGILNGGLFYGSNGSGKTTALHAISILLDLLFKDFTFPSEAICLFSKKKVAQFKYEFIIDENDIVYSFAANDKREIISEKLTINKEEIFTRINNSVKTSLSDAVTQEAPSNILYLRAAYFNTNFINQPVLANWMTYLKNSIYIDRTSNNMVTFNSDIMLDTYLASYIDKYGVDEMNKFLSEYEIPYRIQFQKQVIMGNKYLSIDVENLKTKCAIPFNLESYGNKLMIQLIPYFLWIKKNRGMLLIDEFGGGCHNKLNELFAEFLFKKCKNVQSIIVTHETNLLKTNLIRPDQVFIVDYDEEGAKIHKASDESPRESQNLEKMYLSGVFGGIPLYI